MQEECVTYVCVDVKKREKKSERVKINWKVTRC